MLWQISVSSDNIAAYHSYFVQATSNTESKMIVVRPISFQNAPSTHRLIHCSSLDFHPPVAAFAWGNSMLGMGFPRKLQSGSHPSSMYHSSNLSLGTNPRIISQCSFSHSQSTVSHHCKVLVCYPTLCNPPGISSNSLAHLPVRRPKQHRPQEPLVHMPSPETLTIQPARNPE